MSLPLLEKYFPALTPQQKSQFEMLGSLYPEWNAKINVISRKDIDNLYLHHVLHSLAIAKFLGSPVAGTTFLDMGTGGGFPGIPLAIMWPECRFHLVDRIGKKLTVASSIADAIGLSNVTFQHGDINECRERYDYVVSRAVMRLEALVPLIRKNVARATRPGNPFANGLICLKGGDLQEETALTGRTVQDYPLSHWFTEPFFETKSLIYVPMA